MAWLRNTLDRVEPLFHRGGKLEKYAAFYEMVDTIFYSPGTVTRLRSTASRTCGVPRVTVDGL